MADIFSMTKAELQAFLVERGMKKFRADQIFHYIYQEYKFSWDDMVLLPKKDRAILQEELPIYVPTIVSRLDAPDGTTVKLLLAMADGQTVETVLMMHDYGNSICVSSQVGCAVNCSFCASAKKRLYPQFDDRRNGFSALSLCEVRHAEPPFYRHYGHRRTVLKLRQCLVFLAAHSRKRYVLLRISEYVCIYIWYCAENVCLSRRRNPYTLAVSLHAPNDTLRQQIMPIAAHYPLQEIIAAADHYFDVTGRQVTYEYILIKDLTCTLDCAKELTALMGRRNILINAIPINDNYDVGLHRPAEADINAFMKYLKQHGIHATVRKEMGSAIQAACGQLRIQREKI